ncbi:MAG: DNA primase [Gemmatimonadaceae bacterium]
MIPDEIVDRVREASDIVQIIGEHVALRRVGADYRGPCPFHQGTHRNFSVSPKKGIYYCFVCHEGGDVFAFLQKRLGLDWPAAVRLAGGKAGIEVPETMRRREGPDPREPMWEVNAAVAEFFQRSLWEEDSARDAREYLAGRMITRTVAERFGLGFAPREIGLMRTYLNTLGFDDERLLATGLLVRREEGDEPRPRFRARVIFPIFDVPGRTVGFGGRLLGPGEPKYLNSGDSDVFSKGKLLYGLNWARHAMRREERAIVVEGYFDLVRLASSGIEPVVAPLGTALTDAQATLLRRYTTNVFLLYDSDAAGLRATFRSGDALLAQGMAVRVVTLPEGDDPDSFVRRHGRAALEEQLAGAGAIDILERKLQLLDRAGWFADLQRKRRAIDRLLPTLRATADPLMRELYVGRVSEVAGVSRDRLLDELTSRVVRGATPAARTVKRESRESGSDPRTGTGSTGQDPSRQNQRGRAKVSAHRGGNRGAGAERELVRVMLHRRAEIESLAERVGTEAFRDPRYRSIFAALLEQGPDATVEELASVLGEEAIDVMQELLAEPGAIIDVIRTIEGSLAALRRHEVEAKLAELDALIPLAEGAEKDERILEKRELAREMRSLGGMGQHFGKSRS